MFVFLNMRNTGMVGIVLRFAKVSPSGHSNHHAQGIRQYVGKPAFTNLSLAVLGGSMTAMNRAKKWWETRPWARTEERLREVQTGVALMRHVKSAHQGEYRPDCAGCLELLKRMEEK